MFAVLALPVASAVAQPPTEADRQGEAEAQLAIGLHVASRDLVALLRTSNNKYIRGVAALWLGERRVRQARDALFEGMSDQDVYVQRRAAVAYARVLRCEIPDNLLDSFTAKRATTCEVAIACVMEVMAQASCRGDHAPDHNRLLIALAKAVRNPSANVRREAVALAGRLVAPEAAVKRTALLTEALDDRSADVRFEALRALRGNMDEAAIEKLIELLKDDDERVIRMTLRVLAESGSSRAAEGIATLLRHPRTDFRIEALRALRKLGKPESASDVEMVLSHRSARVRSEAAKTIGVLNPPDGGPMLVPLLEDSDTKVREEAAAGIARICPAEDSETARALALAAGDVRLAVARQAIVGLLCMRSSANVPELVDALCSSPHVEIRQDLVYTLNAVTHGRAGERCQEWEAWLQEQPMWWHEEDRIQAGLDAVRAADEGGAGDTEQADDEVW